MMLFRLLGVAAVVGLSACPAFGLAPVSQIADGNEATPEVQVVGVYEGSLPAGVAHPGGTHPANPVTVKLRTVRKKVILVLTAYEPVVWKIDDPGKAVVRVIASGYYKQAVEGLDKKVPVTLLSHEAGDADYFYARRKEAAPNEGDHERAETKKKYERLVEQVKKLTKQDIQRFQGKYAGSTFEIR